MFSLFVIKLSAQSSCFTEMGKSPRSLAAKPRDPTSYVRGAVADTEVVLKTAMKMTIHFSHTSKFEQNLTKRDVFVYTKGQSA